MIKKTISDIDKNNCSPSQQTELQSQLLARMDKVSSAIREADDLEQMTSDVLDSLLSIFDCDRAWLIFPCDPDAESWQPKMERTKPEYPGGSANKSSQSMAPDTAGTMQILLDSAEPVCFGAGSKYDIAETARQYGVKSSISMALYPKIGKPWMFGLHQCSYPRTWTKEEKDLFSEIGRRLTESLTNILVLLDVRESEERFRQVFNLPCIGMVVFSLDGYLLSANRTFCHMLGHAEEALWKMTHQQLAHPDDLNPDNNKTQQLIDGELPYWQLELRYRHVDGHYKWVRLTSNVIRSAAGEPLYLVAQIDDIDQSKRDEEEIALLNFAINRINETVYLVDKDSRFKYVNDKACQTLGYSRNELLKMHIYDISPLFPKNRWREVWSDLKKRGSVTVETEHRTKDGDIIPVEVNANYFEFDNQSYDLALARDISEQQHNEEILRRSKADLEIALESGNLGYWKWDLSTNNINWSARCNEIYGLSPEVKPTYDLADRMTHPDDRERVRSEFNKAIKDGETFVTEKRIIVPPDGTERWTLTRGKVTFNDSHQPEFVAGIIADITERKLAEGIQRKTALALKESEERFRQMAENIQEVFWLIDMSNREILYASPAHEKLWGKSHRFIDELFESIHPEDKSLVEKLIYSPPTDNATIEYRIIHQDNSVKHIQVSAFPIYDVNGNIYRMAGVTQEITNRKEQEERIQFLAYHDALTGLPNRELVMDRLDQGVAHAQRNKNILAVIFLDIDHFKTINDTLGHLTGDKLLQQVAQRLSGIIRKNDTIGRFGGDEFLILLTELSSPQDAAHATEKIIDSLATPFIVEERKLHINASIGISLYPRDGKEIETLVKYADTALYLAKEQGRNTFRFFSPELDKKMRDRLEMEHDLRYAIDRNEMFLHYQPQLKQSNDEQKLIGAEALLRWKHPVHGFISPAEFIPIAEETGLIIPIGEWVLREASLQAAQWQAQGISDIRVSINLSQRQLEENDITNKVEQILKESGCEPQLIELEITESTAMDKPDEAIIKLQALHDMGIELAIDDFGTGYSSLAYLKRFPFDRIKIDQSFISGIPDDNDDMALVKITIMLALQLRMKIIAEGVETEEQRIFLEENGCNDMQGYLFGKPMLAEDLEKFF